MKTIDEIETKVNLFVRRISAKVGAFLSSVFPELSPNTISISGAIAALAASLLTVWLGLVAGALLMSLSSLFDFCDGPVARAKNNASRFGGVLDDFSDRVGEICYFSAIYLLQPSFCVFLAGISSVLVSYLNATAKANGFNLSSGKVTGRPGRLILLFILMLLSPLLLVTKTLWLIVTLNVYTISRRGLEIIKQSG